MTGERYWRDLVSGRREGVVARLLSAFLVALAIPYGALLRLRSWGYGGGILRSRRLDVPVISVGNLAVGGTGKTPMTLLIARHLLARGARVAVLSRGYGGTHSGAPRIVSDGRQLFMTAAEAGDEPYLLVQELPGLMVVVGRDRYQAGLLAQRELHPDCFLMDDGFQHLRLQRDLDILLLDCASPLGNGWTLPGGLLREPSTAVGRADLVVLTRCEGGEERSHVGPAGIPTLSARHNLSGIVSLDGGGVLPFSALYGEQLFAFAGIAEPGRFFSSLAEAGLDLVGRLALPDHALYDDRTVAGIRRSFRSSGATCLVTTAKDAVKLERYRKQLGRIWVAKLELVLDDLTPLTERLDRLFNPGGDTP